MKPGHKHSLTDDPIADEIKYDGTCNWCHGDMRKCSQEHCPAMRDVGLNLAEWLRRKEWDNQDDGEVKAIGVSGANG